MKNFIYYLNYLEHLVLYLLMLFLPKKNNLFTFVFILCCNGVLFGSGLRNNNVSKEETGSFLVDRVATLPTFDQNHGNPIVREGGIVGIASNLTSDGGSAIIERGFCWSTSPNPTPEDSKIVVASSLGIASATIEGLMPNTTYYVRGYAINSEGVAYQHATGYTFITFDIMPSIIYSIPPLFYGSSVSISPQNSGGAVANQISNHDLWGNNVTSSSLPTLSDAHDFPSISSSVSYYKAFAYDSSGNFYFTDGVNGSAIYKKTPQNVISLYSGSQTQVESTSNTSATLLGVRYTRISDIKFDSNGNMYVLSYRGSTSSTSKKTIVRKITPSGVVSIFYLGITAFSSDPKQSLEITNDGYVYIMRNIPSSTIIAKINSSGTLVTSFSFPQAIIPHAHMFVSDSENNLYFVVGDVLKKFVPVGTNGVLSDYCILPSYTDISSLAIDKYDGSIYVNLKKTVSSIITSYRWEVHKVTGVGQCVLLFSNSSFLDVSNNPDMLVNPFDRTLIVSGHSPEARGNYNPKRYSFLGYQISPSLPFGMSFDTSTGVISGASFDSMMAPTVYTVTAFNSGGFSSTSFTLSFNYHVLEANQSTQTFCLNSKLSDIVFDNLLPDSTLKFYLDSSLTQEVSPNSTIEELTGPDLYLYGGQLPVYIKEYLDGIAQESTLYFIYSLEPYGPSESASIVESSIGIDKKKYTFYDSGGNTAKFVWSIPSNCTIESISTRGDEIIVKFPQNLVSGDAVIHVSSKDICGRDLYYGSRTLAPVIPSISTTDVIPCSGSSIVTYTVEPVEGSSYTWSLPSGMTLISSNNNVAQVNVGSSFVSGNVQVTINSQRSNIISRLAVTRVSAPVLISGKRNICGITSTTYSIEPVDGAISYVWSVPTGMTIVGDATSTSIEVSINENAFASGNVSVYAVTPCGNSIARTLAVSKNIQPSNIVGPKDICNNKTKVLTVDSNTGSTTTTEKDYVVYASGRIDGIDNIQWDVPNGASVVSGQGTFIANVSFDPAVFTGGTISLTNLSSCSGNNPVRNQAVTSGTPTIAGPSSLCGLTTAIYSVPNNGSNYVWTVPSWMTIASGQGTNEITVNFTELCNSDVISLTFESACGGTTPITVNKTGIGCSNYSSLIPTLAGVTLTSFNQNLVAVGVLNPTSYRFVVNDGVSPERTYTSSTKTFNLTNLPGDILSNTTYSISVDVLVDGVWYIGGCATSVTTPSIPVTSVQSSQCNSVLTSYLTPIVANRVSGATKYRFKIIDSNNLEYLHVSTTNSFKLTDVSNLVLTNDTAYQISVAASTGFDIFGSYDVVCTITTPSALLTQLIPAHCNSTLAAFNSSITANSVSGATSYKFKVSGGSVNTEYVSTIRQFKLTDIPNVSITMGTTYQVSVAVGQNGQYHSFGEVCTVTTPLPTLQSTQCGTTLTAINDVISAVAINGATDYKFKLVLVDNPSVASFFSNSVRQCKLTDFSSEVILYYGATYHLSVAAKVNDIWSDYGSPCAITTPLSVSTSLINSHCGSTLTAIDNFITANAVSGATAYKFKVSDVFGNLDFEYVSTTRQFKLTEALPVSNLRYAANYDISVAAMQNGVYHPYGGVCTITTPTKIQSSQCGVTLANIDDFIYADYVDVASEYKFRIVGNGVDLTHISTTRNFKLSDVASLSLSYGVTYEVSVAVKVNNEWSSFGSVCNITTPSPVMTSVISSQCGTTLAAINSFVTANSVSGASFYKFKVQGNNIDIEYVSSTRQFKLTDIPNVNIELDTDYSVSVSAMKDGVFYPFGNVCVISTPSLPKIQPTQCGVTLSSANQDILALFVSGATEYKFKISDGISNDKYYTNSVRVLRLTDVVDMNVQYGKSYQVSVSVKVNDRWSDFGDVCTIKVPSSSISTRVISSQCGTILQSLDSTVFVNSVLGATGYKFEVYSANPSTSLLDVLHVHYSSLNEFKLTNVQGLDVAYNSDYYIKAYVKVLGAWSSISFGCLVSTPSNALVREIGDVRQELKEQDILLKKFSANIYPNPFIESYSLNVSSDSESKVILHVFDNSGRLIENRELDIDDLLNFKFGDFYPSGVYTLIVRQDNNLETIRIIKK